MAKSFLLSKLTISSMPMHVKKQHQIGIQITCDKCEKTFTSRTRLATHDTKVHGIIQTTSFLCNDCGKQCTSKVTLMYHFKSTHMDSTSGIPFFCNVCQHTYKNIYKFKEHNRKNHQGVFDCKFCVFVTKNKFSLTRHMKVKHENDINPDDPQSTPDIFDARFDDM